MRHVRKINNETELQLAYKVRFSVFVDEQQISADAEIDSLDPACVHFVCFDDGGQPLGTARLIQDYDKDNKIGKLGRLAVMKEHRGTGIGREIAAAAEAHARDVLKLEGLVLHAQLSAEAFYRKLGYQADCPSPFLEEGIPHVSMRRSLAS